MAVGIHLDISYGGTLLDAAVQQLAKSTSDYRELLNRLVILLERMECGLTEPSTIDLMLSATAPVKASATATCASVIATDTIVIGGTTLTAVADAATPTAAQFRIGSGGGAGQNAECAANIVKAIAANTTINKLVTATSAAAVVTIKALNYGIEGNKITLTSAGGTITVTGSGYLASGAGRDTIPYTTGGTQTVAATAQAIPFSPTTGAGKITFTTP